MDSGSVAQLLRDTRKKDEDARLIQQGDDLYLETTILESSAEYAPMPQQQQENVASMMEHAATSPVPDMRVQSIYYMFLLHHLVLLCVLVFALPIYYIGLSRQATIIVLSTSLVLFSILYVNMIFWRKFYQARVSMACLAGWTLCFAASIGSIATMLNNTAPFQLVISVWAQTVAVIVYCRLSPRILVPFPTAMLFMMGTMLLVWASGLALFVVEHDWRSAVVVLCISLACCVYHTFQLKRMEEYAYNSSWADVMLSIVQFYKVWPN
jgi:hypothetical protein